MRPRRPQLINDRFWKLPSDSLRYIIGDAGEAAQNMRGFDPAAEAIYLDQINDAETVLRWRATTGRQA